MPGQRPRIVKYPLCGTEFAITSCKIHIKSYRQKEIKSNEYRKKKIDVDGIIERFMKGLEGGNAKTKIKAKGVYDIDNLNEEAFEQPSDLVKCNNCERSFVPDN